MAKFEIKWPEGKVETDERSDCATVDQYINSRFGRNAKPAAKVTLVDGAVKEEPVKKTIKK